MRQQRKTRAPSWSSEEIAILCDIYPREGINGTADALPERSWHAIQVMAHKLGVRSSLDAVVAPKARLSGADLEQAIVMREQQGVSFEAIGKHFGLCEIAAQNAILIALCPRKGFVPAQRDANGRLTAEGKDRLREMLRQGRKAVDISLQLGLSAARIAKERRDYNADLKQRGKRKLPPPGNGIRYSGVRIPRDIYEQVDTLLMAGHGAPRIADMVGVSKTHILRRRTKLISRLRRKGECLPGCDREGRRIAYKNSLASVSETQKAVVRDELMKGTPVARAAKIAVIGATYAYKLRDELKAELARSGKALPPTRYLKRDEQKAVNRALDWLPTGKANLLLYRRFLAEVGGNADEARRRTIAELMPKPVPPPVKRRLTFEEQLARIASGQSRIVEKIPIGRPDYAYSLGGVASGML